ncbi:hypothetical protein [Nocardioides okcheonensis]|uniref:hypothetical protein n=1 Tax=Nocardioides okcheonensis TaxID=2894081 RepID=UPI001E2C6D6E|nr:hypothetical protein [Nocardioides okcheonensis]UFN44516.1 hypothetical protein LN652_21145 [Nocardioides okcheonensis]
MTKGIDMTPTQHKAAAETLLADLTSTTRNQFTDQRILAMTTHAVLAQTAGTGSHYTSADALLAEAELPGRAPSVTQFRIAHTHALLADRA